MNVQELIKQKQKQIRAKKGSQIKTIKPQPGKGMYRILPGWNAENRSLFFQDFGMHWVKEEVNGKPVAVHICEDKTFGKPCDICMAIAEATRRATTDQEIEIIKEANATQKYLLNVLHRSSENKDDVQVLEVGSTIFEAIAELISEYGDITDLEEGLDIIIKREGTGFDTKYTVLPANKRVSVDKKVMDKLVNLEEAVSQRDATKHQKALNTLASVVGLVAADPHTSLPSKSPTSIASELSDMEDIEDVAFDEAGDLDEGALDELMKD